MTEPVCTECGEPGHEYCDTQCEICGDPANALNDLGELLCDQCLEVEDYE